MAIERVHPYVESDDLAAAREFYAGALGLEVAMEDPVLALRSAARPSAQVILFERGFEDPPPDLGIDVGDPAAVDEAHRRATALGLRIVYEIRNEPWGVRRFFVEDPDGKVVNVLAHLPSGPDSD